MAQRLEIPDQTYDSSSSTSPISTSPVSGISTPATERSLSFEEPEYVLVTGGLGFIGSHTTVELLKAGHNVLIIDDLRNAHREVFDRVKEIAEQYHSLRGTPCPQAKHFEHSYSDLPAMKQVLDDHSTFFLNQRISRIIGVIHFAALKAVAESIQQPLRYYRNNLNGLVDFLDLLEEHQIKTFIFSSSATVYGTIADRGTPVREEDCVHRPETYSDGTGVQQQAEQGCTGLTNPYGRTKFFGEAILADVAASDPSWTIIALRYFNPIGCDPTGLIGEDPKGIPSNLLPVVVKVMTGQYPELSMFGSDWPTPDGTAIRDYIHVTDLAQGHIAAFSAARRKTLRENFRTFNLGTGTGYSVEEVASTMQKVSNLPIPRKHVERRPGDVGTCVAVADRATEELQWRTQKSLTEACEDMCRFLKISS